ncbi:phage tail protein [Lysinibacillus xylanilyticus]|uniref:phage tail protein n=1 Tax=Lysinibacillus xylanilyticus TaxID=582475 RepID=UPI003D99E037
MSESFYTILTNAGLAAIANATVNQRQVNFAKIGVGDGNGAYYTPTQEATALRKQVWIGNVSSVTTDSNNANWVVVETVIPGNVGGFEIRELGIFDENNVLLAIGKLPLTYKPNFAEGSSKDLYIKAIFEVTNASAVTLKVDPSVIYASKKYVDDKVATVVSGLENIQQQLNQHAAVIDTKVDNHIEQDDGHVWYAGDATGDIGKVITTDKIFMEGTPSVRPKVGVAFRFKNVTANTGAPTLSIRSAKYGNSTSWYIVNSRGANLKAGDLKAGIIYTVAWTGTSFQLQGEGGEYGNAVAADVAKGKTFGTDSGLQTGTAVISSLPPFMPNKYRLYASGTQYSWNWLTSPIFSRNGLFGITATNTPADVYATKIFRLTTSGYTTLMDSTLPAWAHLKNFITEFRSAWYLDIASAPTVYQLYVSSDSTFIDIYQIETTKMVSAARISAAKKMGGGISGVMHDGFMYTIERGEGSMTYLHKMYAPYQGGAGSLITTYSVQIDSLYASGYRVQLIDGYVVFTRSDFEVVRIYDLTLTLVKVISATYGDGQDALLVGANITGLLNSSIVYDRTTGAFGQKNTGLERDAANIHTYPYNWLTSNG